MSNSGMPTSNGGTVSSNNTVNYPSVRSTTAERERIKSVKLASDYTAVEIISNNQSGSSYYQWCNINRNTYIMVNGTQYTMTKAEGIKIAPEKKLLFLCRARYYIHSLLPTYSDFSYIHGFN